MIFGKFCLDPAVGVRATDETPSTTGIVNGAAYLDDESGLSYACIDTGAVADSDSIIGGFRYTSAGALRVSDVTAGLPASSSVNQGILMTDDGQVCFSTAAGGTVLNGVSLTDDGAVSMAVMTFLLEFEDLGSGEVDTTATFGSVSATFTRSGATATTVGSDGLIIKAIAEDTPRSYYDPTTLEYLGYLAEGARTNLCLSSEDFRSAAAGNPVTEWTNTDTTVTVAGTTAPDGALTGNLFTEGTAGTAQVFSDYTAPAADATNTASVWLKRGNHDWVTLILFDVSAGANSVQAWFNISTGAVGTVQNNGNGAGASATIKAYPNGWYRCTLSGIPNPTNTDYALLTRSATADGGATRVSSGTRYQWGCQYEAAAFASSYIPTTTASVTRNADVLTYPTTGWLNADAGTFYSGVQRFFNDSANLGTITQIDAGSSANYIGMFYGTSGAGDLRVADSSSSQVNMQTANTVSANTTANIITCYEANNFAACLNGSTVVTDTSGTVPSSLATLRVGHFVGSSLQLFGPIRRVAYYNARLPNATLQALTD